MQNDLIIIDLRPEALQYRTSLPRVEVPWYIAIPAAFAVASALYVAYCAACVLLQ